MAQQERIPFHRVSLESGQELRYLEAVLNSGRVAGDGAMTARCHEWLEQHHSGAKALLTHSCTGALEMIALLLDLGPGDEVVMPSFTFSSTANAVALRGATPVFVDVRDDTLNLDEKIVAEAIGPKTKAICAVHYAGVACEMDRLTEIALNHDLVLYEDAAQALMAKFRGRELGSIGAMGALSFHETKNLVSGEGGALLIRDEKYIERAEILREKGTNRKKFLRGQVDKYTWSDLGSSYLPSELVAAVLLSQLERAQEVTNLRLDVWTSYQKAFEDLEKKTEVRRPVVPAECQTNAHIYALRTRSAEERTQLIQFLHDKGIQALFHYVPLHSSPAGRKLGRTYGDMRRTNEAAERLVRLPLWPGLTDVQRVIEKVYEFYRK